MASTNHLHSSSYQLSNPSQFSKNFTKENIEAWLQDPVQQTQILREKIQTLARKAIAAVIIAKPTAQKF